jgi:hypothetical protein
MRTLVSRASVLGPVLSFALGCGRPDGVVGIGGHPPDSSLDGSSPPDTAGFELVGAPLLFAPTADGFGINVALRAGDPAALRARVRGDDASPWIDLGLPTTPAPDLAQWRATGLAPGRRYSYEVAAAPDGTYATLYAGTAVTTRPRGATFTFAAVTDAHIEPPAQLPPGTELDGTSWASDEMTLAAVAKDVGKSHPDFVLSLGDQVDYHILGFNATPPDTSYPHLGMLDYRRMFGDALGSAAHFNVIGNWDGESGCNTAAEIEVSRSQRLLYLPGPMPATYPEGGSAAGDYYAFTWGDALFVVLNVMSYTPSCHLLDYEPGRPDDWTLGTAQLGWLRTTLANATSKWRFLFIHHTVGGAAGDATNSSYGRGGGQAAHVGEQDTIHKMMMQYGVQVFFYAHDHVFTDMVVDGIHYTLPGSAGAPWKFTTAETGYTRYFPDSGHARVIVSPDSVAVDFVAQGGKLLDGYVLR